MAGEHTLHRCPRPATAILTGRVSQLDVIAHAMATAPATGSGSEEARAFFQRRVCQLSLVLSLVFGAFLLWRLIAVFTGDGGPKQDSDFLVYQFGQVGPLLGLWLYSRGRARSFRHLRIAELSVAVVVAACVMLMGSEIPYMARPDYIVVLALTYLLLVRTVFIPTTARTTAILGISLGVIMLPVLFWIHYKGHDPGMYGPSAPEPLREGGRLWWGLSTFVNFMWWASAVAVATIAARVIHGLRRQARDARRLGQYTLLDKIGKGGMGEVYRARHAMLRRPTAIKLLPPEQLGEHSIERFEREVQLTAQLTHPNTIRVFDYGRTSDQVFYYAMELIEGADLARVVETTGPMPPGRVIHLLRQCAGALAEAHQIGLIHRDIKPGNILLTEQGGVPDVVKLVDFGLVKQVPTAGADSESAPVATLTREDSFTGTPQYSAPESITKPTEVDARVDIYALGAVGYFLLTGAHVFGGGTMVEILGHHLHSDPAPLSALTDQDIPAELEQILRACLAKSRDDRPADAGSLRALLGGCPGADSWTEDDARAWWRRHRASLVESAGPAGSGAAELGAASTVAVELDVHDSNAV